MRKKKLDRRVKMSKSFLKEALISLLEKKHISEITVKELCELADVNRSTFYAHYEHLYDLLNEMENDIISELKRALHSYMSVQGNNALLIIENLIEFIGSKHSTCEVLLSPNSNISFEKKIRNIVHQSLLSDWKEASLIEERYFDYISAFLISGSIEVVKTWLQNNRDQTPQEIAHLIYHLANQGIAR